MGEFFEGRTRLNLSRGNRKGMRAEWNRSKRKNIERDGTRELVGPKQRGPGKQREVTKSEAKKKANYPRGNVIYWDELGGNSGEKRACCGRGFPGGKTVDQGTIQKGRNT